MFDLKVNFTIFCHSSLMVFTHANSLGFLDVFAAITMSYERTRKPAYHKLCHYCESDLNSCDFMIINCIANKK